MSHTYAVLDVSPAAYREIRAALEAAGYQHAFHADREVEVIDMHGVALRESKVEPHRRKPEAEARAGSGADVRAKVDREHSRDARSERDTSMKRTPLRPGTKPLKAKKGLRRRTRLNPVNPERQARMRLQQFGGPHRDRIVSMPCCVCGARAPSDPAHTTPRGMGGVKGKWYHLIPLCWLCHGDHDNYRGPFADPEVRRELELRAYRLAWESYDYGYAPRVPPVPRPGRL